MLISENSKITFSIHRVPQKYATREDWIYLFNFEKGRDPIDDEEYNEFIALKEQYAREYWENLSVDDYEEETENDFIESEEVNIDSEDTDESA